MARKNNTRKSNTTSTPTVLKGSPFGWTFSKRPDGTFERILDATERS